MPSSAPTMTAWWSGSAWKKSACTATAATIEHTNCATAPSTVLFGLMTGASGCRPSFEPTAYAAVNGPTRPMNMVAVSTSLVASPKQGVMPVERPVVVAADTVSKARAKKSRSGSQRHTTSNETSTKISDNAVTATARRMVRGSIARPKISGSRPRSSARNVASITTMVVVFMPPAVEPGDPPIIISTIVTLLFIVISLVIIGMSAVNIAHTFFMLISDRKREIGILRAVGATKADVRRIILGEAAAVGAVAGALGIVIGVASSLIIDFLSRRFVPDFPFKPDSYFLFTPLLLGGALLFAVVFCVLGAYQVSERGDLANWHTGKPGDIPAVGGAMDLAIGAKDVYVMMTLFTKSGAPKLVPQCTYPLTGVGCVSRVYTEVAAFDLRPDGVHVLETYGVTLEELRSRLAIELH